MNIFIFLIILIALILVHEYGHFVTAKWIGAKVEEFGIGYPPKAFNFGKIKGTVFSFNWIPFGGFVRIFGEQREKDDDNDPEAFYSKSKSKQAFVIFAGVLFNFLFAWILLSTSFIIGAPVSADINDPTIKDQKLVITSVFENTPAYNAGLKTGDEVLSIKIGENEYFPQIASDFQEIIANSLGQEMVIKIKEFNLEKEIKVSAEFNQELQKSRLGVGIDRIGVKKTDLFSALISGLKASFNMLKMIFNAFVKLIYGAITGSADLSQITGPVGIVKAVGDAYDFGLSYLLSFTALISINLVIINLLPVPALDGGRLLFLGIEAITRKRIKIKIARIANTIGFFALILFMLVITFNDIKNLFIG